MRQVAATIGPVWAPETEETLVQACVEIRAYAPARLVIVGGDGSLRRILSALCRTYGAEALPRIALVPAGTVNLAASRFGIEGGVLRNLRSIQNASPNVTRTVQSLRLTIDGEIHVGFTLGTGLISHFFEAYEQARKPGKGAAAAIFARTFVGSWFSTPFARKILAPIVAELCVDGDELGKLELTLLVCSVFSNLGLGLKPTYLAGSVPGKLHLVASTLPSRSLGPLAWRVLLGKPLKDNPVAPEVIDCMTSRFSVTFQVPTGVILDGDAISARTVTVELGPDLVLERN